MNLIYILCALEKNVLSVIVGLSVLLLEAVFSMSFRVDLQITLLMSSASLLPFICFFFHLLKSYVYIFH